MSAPSCSITRRGFLALAAAAPRPAASDAPTRFQIACMTHPYSPFTFERALDGIASAGYEYVAWGTRHTGASGQVEELIDFDGPRSEALRLAAMCRDRGLEPVMMFSRVYVAAETSIRDHTRRIEQAADAGIPFVMTFGHVEAGGREVWTRNLRELGKIARDHGVSVLIKQHGGNTATGVDCQRIVQDVGDDNVKICYDAGNVLDYENEDPIPDIQACWSDVRAFAIKDHRNWPKDADCGPGFGEIDHYRLLQPVAFTGLDMPLACENIFEPLVERPKDPAGVDALARRAREYLETVTRGLQRV
jgi:sugar phosphate isomerase/epimerase